MSKDAFRWGVFGATLAAFCYVFESFYGIPVYVLFPFLWFVMFISGVLARLKD
jgi:hypothetical protein